MASRHSLTLLHAAAFIPALIAGLLLCGMGQAGSQESGSAPVTDIPGAWLVQRLGTPDNGFFFADANHGWGQASQAQSAIFRTTDGGVNWQAHALGHSQDAFRVNDVFFATVEEGWATGRRDMADLFWNGIFIVHTTDGGATWTDQIGMAGQRMASSPGRKIWFLDTQRGWVQQGDSYLWRTADGGQHWVRLAPSGMPTELLRFINATTGFGVLTPPWSGPELMRTNNGGETWYGVGLAPDWANALWVDDGGVVWAVGKDGKIARSPNGGVTWTPIASPTWNTLNHLTFVDNLKGWAAGAAGAVLRTTDGGWNWTIQKAGTTQAITSLAVAAPNQAWVYADRLRRTRDGGATWSPLRLADAAPLYATSMGSALVGWAGGAGPYLLVTADGGRQWSDQADALGGIAWIDAVDAQHAWAAPCEQPCAIRRTTDGGAHWSALALPSGAPADLDFVDANRGWSVGGSSISATTDGGLTWRVQYSDTLSTMLHVSFVSSTRGWVMSRGQNYARHILGTTDGGAHWMDVTTIAGISWRNDRDIDFVDADHGWLIDDSSNVPPPDPAPGQISRTTDGGATWQQVRGPGMGNYEWYHALDFADAQEGWVVGDYGLILHTTDGGATWTAMEHPTRLTLRGVHAAGPGLAWIVGDSGLILHYSATQPPGCWATPTPHPASTGAPPPVGTVDRQVAHCFDDAYVRIDTGELLYDTGFVRMGGREGGAVPYVAAFLFRDVRIPQGAEITSARLQLQPWGYQSGTPIMVLITGDGRSQSEDFNPLNWPAQERPRTAAAVPWTLADIPSSTTDSPDIAAVVREIVGLDGWIPGNNLGIFMDPSSASQHFVNWDAYDYQPSLAARLIASYKSLATPTPTPTQTPTATATATLTRTPTPTGAIPTWLPLLVTSAG